MKIASHSSDRTRTRRRERTLEKLALFHVGALLLLATWLFGGGSERARWMISCWGSLGAAITLSGILKARKPGNAPGFPVAWLWPLAAINVLVIASCLNPSFTEKVLEGESFLAQTGAAHPALPSTAHVATSLRHLWLFDALYFSAFNLLLVSRRGHLRALLQVVVGNAILLSIMGTLQKLLSDGIFFGAVPSPNARFFATFVYGNHWAAFAVLTVAIAGGLLFRQVDRGEGNVDARGRMALDLVGILLVAVTPLIAGSRAGTFMMLVLLVGFGARASRNAAKRAPGQNRSAVRPVAVALLCGMVAVGGAVWLGREALQDRFRDTRSQLREGPLSGRRELYRDTWQLVTQQPAFGWGLGNYGKVFQLVRPRPLELNRQYERSYADAHSDWLQALSEVGFFGTLLFGLTAVGPLWTTRKFRLRSPVVVYALLGCALIAVYAVVEFPFANPAVVITWWTLFFCAVQYARLGEAQSQSRLTAEDPVTA